MRNLASIVLLFTILCFTDVTNGCFKCILNGLLKDHKSHEKTTTQPPPPPPPPPVVVHETKCAPCKSSENCCDDVRKIVEKVDDWIIKQDLLSDSIKELTKLVETIRESTVEVRTSSTSVKDLVDIRSSEIMTKVIDVCSFRQETPVCPACPMVAPCPACPGCRPVPCVQPYIYPRQPPCGVPLQCPCQLVNGVCPCISAVHYSQNTTRHTSIYNQTAQMQIPEKATRSLDDQEEPSPRKYYIPCPI